VLLSDGVLGFKERAAHVVALGFDVFDLFGVRIRAGGIVLMRRKTLVPSGLVGISHDSSNCKDLR